MTQAAHPDAELIARAVITAAACYGDDPQRALMGDGYSERRSLAAAADALGRVFGLNDRQAQRLLNLPDSTLHNRRKAPLAAADFRRASEAVEAVLRGALRARDSVPARTAVEPDHFPTPPWAARALAARPPSAPHGTNMPAPRVAAPMAGLPEAAPMVLPSSLAGSRVAGRPADPRRLPRRARAPVGDLPPRAEDRSAEGFEARQVAALRARRVPWAHVARQIGKSLDLTRRLYDRDYRDA